jgi:hypothetical protein
MASACRRPTPDGVSGARAGGGAQEGRVEVVCMAGDGSEPRYEVVVIEGRSWPWKRCA